MEWIRDFIENQKTNDLAGFLETLDDAEAEKIDDACRSLRELVAAGRSADCWRVTVADRPIAILFDSTDGTFHLADWSRVVEWHCGNH